MDKIVPTTPLFKQCMAKVDHDPEFEKLLSLMYNVSLAEETDGFAETHIGGWINLNDIDTRDFIAHHTYEANRNLTQSNVLSITRAMQKGEFTATSQWIMAYERDCKSLNLINGNHTFNAVLLCFGETLETFSVPLEEDAAKKMAALQRAAKKSQLIDNDPMSKLHTPFVFLDIMVKPEGWNEERGFTEVMYTNCDIGKTKTDVDHLVALHVAADLKMSMPQVKNLKAIARVLMEKTSDYDEVDVKLLTDNGPDLADILSMYVDPYRSLSAITTNSDFEAELKDHTLGKEAKRIIKHGGFGAAYVFAKQSLVADDVALESLDRFVSGFISDASNKTSPAGALYNVMASKDYKTKAREQRAIVVFSMTLYAILSHLEGKKLSAAFLKRLIKFEDVEETSLSDPYIKLRFGGETVTIHQRATNTKLPALSHGIVMMVADKTPAPLSQMSLWFQR